MKNTLHDLLGQATRLTQGGDLMGATDLIQRALRGEPAATPAADPSVIDAEARFIDEPARADAPRGNGLAESWQAGSFAHGGRQLAYKLYVPPGAATGPRPLLLMLHGCTQDPDDFAAGTRMNALAREAGVLVLYPEQTQHANAQKCWNWFKAQHQQRDRGEPALLAALTRAVAADHGADPARIYVAGLSAGGAMADILGRCYPDVFAAVGVHSGLPAGAAADLPSALAAMRSGAPAGAAGGDAVRPVIVFHGDADGTVHHGNGAAVVAAALRAHPTASADVRRGQAPNGQRYTHSVHRTATGTPVVERWQLHGTGHAWSGGSAAGSYTAPGGVDASAEMLRFFLAHRRPSSA